MAGMKVNLTVVEGSEKGRSFSFDEPENFLIGRNAEGSKAHLRLSPQDTYVSRNHFLLEINPPDCFIRDAGSLNGTFIVRPASKAVFFLPGRGEDLEKYNNEAEELQKQLSYKVFSQVSDRLTLQDKDMIKVGRTVLCVEVTKSWSISDDCQISLNKSHERTFRCIECDKEISRPSRVTDARKLSSDDYICESCRKKHAEAQKPKDTYTCYQCGNDVSEIANKDGQASEYRDVAMYTCEACLNAYLKDKQPTLMGDYTVVTELGAGGFGTVYLTRHRLTGRLAALKLTQEVVKNNTGLLERFKREIAIMKKLKHPNLVRLYDEGITDGGNYYLISEYLPKGNLSEYCWKRHSGMMPFQKACGILAHALKGLAWFHEKGYVHRDIKPANILLKRGDGGHYQGMIADFGIARSYVLHGGTVTRGNEWIGTTFYCPPEQILDFKNPNPATDVYAMGMALYYILSGEFPYDFRINEGDKKQRDPIAFILGDDKPVSIEKKVAGLPTKLAIEKDIKKRLQTAEEFGWVLRECTE